MSRPWIRLYPSPESAEINLENIQSISDRLQTAFNQYKKQPAATCLGVTITYGELDRSIDAFSRFLQSTLKIQKGDRIAVMLPNSFQFLITELAAFRIGAVCVNTNPLYTPREMRHQFTDSGATAIVIMDMFASKLEEILTDTKIKHVVVTSIADQFPAWKGLIAKGLMSLRRDVPRFHLEYWPFTRALRDGRRNPPLEIRPMSLQDTAILQYTGGTTGVSKGAMLSHQNILANMAQINAMMGDHLSLGSKVVLTALPLYHVFALSVNFLTFLAQGQHLILVPKPVPIDNTAQLFREFPISVMTGVNTLFNNLNNSKLFREIAPKTLKVVVAGGMALQDHVNKAFQSITGVRITEGFGLTEASPVTHCNPLGIVNPVGSIGIPLPSTDARIVRDDGSDAQAGEVGELVVKGPQVMKGYWQQDEETAKVIRDQWLWTGDMARMDERGYFYIVDRKKDMILVSGFNVYPNEVEEVICKHPKVLEAAVVGVPDKSTGEAVKAFITAKDPTLTVDDMKKYCRENLAGYKCPRHFRFLDSLPKSNVGKILRKDLRNLE